MVHTNPSNVVWHCLVEKQGFAGMIDMNEDGCLHYPWCFALDLWYLHFFSSSDNRGVIYTDYSP